MVRSAIAKKKHHHASNETRAKARRPADAAEEMECTFDQGALRSAHAPSASPAADAISHAATRRASHRSPPPEQPASSQETPSAAPRASSFVVSEKALQDLRKVLPELAAFGAAAQGSRFDAAEARAAVEKAWGPVGVELRTALKGAADGLERLRAVLGED